MEITSKSYLSESEGKRHTVFSPGAYWLEPDVKALFTEAGYTFQPVGVVGGIRQLDEYICW